MNAVSEKREGAAAKSFVISPYAKKGGLKAGEGRFGFFLLLPAIIAFSTVVMFPFLKALSLSLYEYTLQTPEPIFIGLQNFATVFADPGIRGAFVTTTIYVVCTTAFSMILGLSWAMIVNQPFRGRAVVRSISLLPWIMPATVTAFLFAWIFNSRFGVLNAVLLELGVIDLPQAWLSNPTGAMAAIIMTKVWLSIPLFMSFFLAGLQSLDKEQLEAARVDGAGNFNILKDHMIPHLRPVLLVVTVLGMIGNLQQFDSIYALTGGGPVRATMVLSVEVYRRAFEMWDIGIATTVGVLWVATILPPAYFYLRELMKGS